jgi:hypothetical protein
MATQRKAYFRVPIATSIDDQQTQDLVSLAARVSAVETDKLSNNVFNGQKMLLVSMINNKADASTLDALATTVEGKADATALTTLASVVDTKADASVLDAKADASLVSQISTKTSALEQFAEVVTDSLWLETFAGSNSQYLYTGAVQNLSPYKRFSESGLPSIINLWNNNGAIFFYDDVKMYYFYDSVADAAADNNRWVDNFPTGPVAANKYVNINGIPMPEADFVNARDMGTYALVWTAPE